MASDSIEQALQARLLSTTASTAVNDALKHRIFFVTADQGVTRPYATYQVVSDPHDPFSFDKGQAGQARVQFNVYPSSTQGRYGALSLAHVVRDNLDQVQGSFDGVSILECTCGGVLVRSLPEEDNGFMATFDAIVRYVDP